MPLPIPIVVGGVAAVVTLTANLMKPKMSKRLAGKRVAILGGQQVGKTTILRYLEFDGLLEGEVRRTADAAGGGSFTLDVAGADTVFDVQKDLPGDQGLQYKDWREAVDGADHVWYLFRADLVAEHNPEQVELIRKHLLMLWGWLDSKKADRPKVILVGTHADRHELFESDPARLSQIVRNADALKINAVKLNAGVVVGSLATEDAAKRLRRSLRGQL